MEFSMGAQEETELHRKYQIFYIYAQVSVF